MAEEDEALLEDWSSVKRSLASEFPRLKVAVASVDFLILQQLQELRKNQRLKYDPLLLDRHSGDVVALLDRCLSFRREARELEVAAFSTYLEYARSLALHKIDQEIEQVDHDTSGVEAGLAASEKTSKAYAAAGGLGFGFEAKESADRDEDRIQVELTRKRRRLVQMRRSTALQFLNRAYARTWASGTAHNYLERMQRIVTLLVDDLNEALGKSEALFEGIHMVFRKRFRLPQLNERFNLDSVVDVVRDALRHLDMEYQRETEISIILPLRQPWKGQFVENAEFWSRLAEGEAINFNIPEIFGPNVRLRSFGLSVAFAPPRTDFIGSIFKFSWASRMHSLRFTAEVKTPAHLLDDGIDRNPIVLGDVGVFGFGQPTLVSGGGCENIDPQGSWSVRLFPHPVTSHMQGKVIFEPGGILRGPTLSIDGILISDIKLHLVLKGRIGESLTQGDRSNT